MSNTIKFCGNNRVQTCISISVDLRDSSRPLSQNMAKCCVAAIFIYLQIHNLKIAIDTTLHVTTLQLMISKKHVY